MVMLALGSLTGALVSSSRNTTASPTYDQNDFASNQKAPEQYPGNTSSNSILYVSNLTTPQSTAERVAELANASIIQAVTSYLSSFDSRYTGTQGSLSAISYIKNFLATNCSIQNVYLDNFTFNDEGKLIQASNIIARIDAPNQTSRTLLVTAHHDSIGYQYPFDVYINGTKGADDDASGVGALLETARVLSLFKQYLKYNVLFVVFAAEEGNRTLDPAFMRQGSIHWVSSSHAGVDSLSDIIGVVNLDGVGYEFGGPIGEYYHSSGKTVALNLTSSATMLNISIVDEGHARTDSYLKPIRSRSEDTFDNASIPAVTLSTHYTDPFVDTTQDTVANLDFGLACNFTKIVLCYVYLTCGLMPKPEKTYYANWSLTLCSNAQCAINETNYIDILVKPSIVSGYQLVILDPSLGEVSAIDLRSIATACHAVSKGLPILSIGRIGVELLQALTQNEIEFTLQNSSNQALDAYIDSNLTSIAHHPVFNSPSNITLTRENDTVLSYVVTNDQLNANDTSCYLVRDTIQTNSPLLQMGYTPYASKLWTWLGILNTQNSSYGPVVFIGAEDPRALTDTSRAIVGNMVHWLLNGPTTTMTVQPSEEVPLVGDNVKVDVSLRSSLTWQGNSSVAVNMTVTSPSGNPLLNEVLVTDQDGIAESSALFLVEIGQYKVNASTLIGGKTNASIVITTAFNSDARINAHLDEDSIFVIQGESASIQLSLTYMPITPDNMTLILGGACLSSNMSYVMAFCHGSRNVSFPITARESAPPGAYNLTLVIMPKSGAYIACEQPIRILVTRAYEISIIEAPAVMAQGSRSEILLQVKSFRSVPVSYDLRIDSTNIVVRGMANSTIPAGGTQQITLPIEEASSSPYCWGDGKIQVVLIRNGVPVARSLLLLVSVSISSVNLLTGYILPPALLVLILVNRFRKASVKRTTVGTFLGGSAFFALGLLISQSIFMAIPISMLLIGAFAGTAAARYISDKPLPKDYDWLIPSDVAEDAQRNRQTKDNANK
jgi:hypothetical protein